MKSNTLIRTIRNVLQNYSLLLQSGERDIYQKESGKGFYALEFWRRE